MGKVEMKTIFYNGNNIHTSSIYTKTIKTEENTHKY